jgi:hypothetical protein
MMIPVRIPADARPHIAAVKHVQPDHLLAESPFDCPVCDETLSDRCVALVAVGIEPHSRKPAGWCTGGAVGVHAECAGADPKTCTCRVVR